VGSNPTLSAIVASVQRHKYPKGRRNAAFFASCASGWFRICSAQSSTECGSGKAGPADKAECNRGHKPDPSPEPTSAAPALGRSGCGPTASDETSRLRDAFRLEPNVTHANAYVRQSPCHPPTARKDRTTAHRTPALATPGQTHCLRRRRHDVARTLLIYRADLCRMFWRRTVASYSVSIIHI